jgi:hypothetical protein
MQFRLRTLLIVLALGPPLLWGGFVCWGRYSAWRAEILLEHEFKLQSMREFVPLPLEPLGPYEGDGKTLD